MSRARPAGSYGIDAPWVPWLWLGLGVLYLALTVCGIVWWDVTAWGNTIVAVIGVLFLCGAALYWHATLRGKFLVWRGLLDELPAPPRALDMGCGRGAVAIMTALRFPSAHVEGVDLWRSIDQSGNGEQAAIANAEVSGVADRISFATADMTALPSPDAAYDLVTASLSIHNIPTADGRAQAITEAWRVLAPGGRLVIVDISKVGEYIVTLRGLGAEALQVRPAGWRMWWSGPWMATRILTAVKAPV